MPVFVLFTLFWKMAEEKCDGLATVIKEQGDLIRSLKLNSAPKEQVSIRYILTRRFINILHILRAVCFCVRDDAILWLWVKCGIAECGMRKVKCGIKNAE